MASPSRSGSAARYTSSHFAGGGFEFVDEFLLAFDDFVVRLEAVFDIHREIALGQILNMTEGSFDDKLLAQVFVDGLRLRRRLHDYQSFWHIELSECGALRRVNVNDCRITQ